MQTGDIKAAMRARYCAPEWALMFEVGDGTGMNQRRWADAVAMNVWPSRGMEVHGFEIKVSRGDWQRELKNPAKAESVQRYCDRWWVVTAPGIVKDGELPPTWGLLEVGASGKFKQISAAPALSPKAIDRTFIAAMLRRASGVDEEEVRAAVSIQVEALRASDRKSIENEIQNRSHRHAALRKAVDEIEHISGVKINEWGNSEEIGRAVKLVIESGAVQTHGGLQSLRKQIALTLEDFDKALAGFSLPSGAAGDC